LSTRRCPRCQTTYPAPARYCVKDGSPLVEAESTATFAPAAGRGAAAGPPFTGVHTEEYIVTPEELDRCATLSGKLLDRRYQVGRRLGEGGMSYVYRAQDVETNATIAVKILLPRLSRDPAAVERLRREATIATRLETELAKLRADIFRRDALITCSTATALHCVAGKETELGADVSFEHRSFSGLGPLRNLGR